MKNRKRNKKSITFGVTSKGNPLRRDKKTHRWVSPLMDNVQRLRGNYATGDRHAVAHALSTFTNWSSPALEVTVVL